MNKEWSRVALQILTVKLAVLAIAAGTYFFYPSHAAKNNQNAAMVWYQWDGIRYLTIAENGYVKEGAGAENIVFYPVFPYLIRFVGKAVGSIPVAGLVLAHLFSFAGLFAFYALARFEMGPDNARWSLWALLLFPTAYFFHAPYTEGIFLMWAAGSFLMARQGKWGWAGALGAGAVLTRITGICLFPALVAEFFLQRREKKIPLANTLWLLLLPAACGIYLLINWLLFGDAFAFLDFQASMWNRYLSWPWVGLWNKLLLIFYVPGGDYWWNVCIAEVAAGFLLIFGAVHLFRKGRLTYAVYVLFVALLCLCTSFILSVPRYVLGAFPIFFLHQPPNGRPTTKMALLGSLSVALMIYYLGRYIRGIWAF